MVISPPHLKLFTFSNGKERPMWVKQAGKQKLKKQSYLAFPMSSAQAATLGGRGQATSPQLDP